MKMYGDEIIKWLEKYDFLNQAFAGIYSIENLPKAKSCLIHKLIFLSVSNHLLPFEKD